MSAFVVARVHIDVLVAVALDGPRNQGTVRPDRAWQRPFRWYLRDGCSRTLAHDNADEVGRMLLAENVASVGCRYGDKRPLPGSCDVAETYVYTTHAYRPTIVETLAALRCYEYQSCEHPEWRDSSAAAFCDALRSHLIALLPGMDDAPWEWTDATLVTRRAAAAAA